MIDLTPATVARLQVHAVPLIDTFDSVINRAVDALESAKGTPTDPADGTAQTFNPSVPPNLTHTKVLAIEFDGKALPHNEANWNGMLYAVIRRAKEIAKSPEELKKLMLVNVVEGKKTTDGYKYLSDIGLSVQGQDANGAWKGARHICQQLGLRLAVTFIWRTKEGAEFPGTTGQLVL
jgi:hypothetical protein